MFKSNKTANESTTKEVFDTLDESVIKSEKFLEKNLKSISITLFSLLIAIGGYFAYVYLYKNKRNNKAMEEMTEAQKFFYQEDYKKALNGGGSYYGFEEIIEDFGGTNTGNVAKYYASISYYKLKKYDKSIELMKNFDSKGDNSLSSIKNGVIADAFVQINNYEEADSYYKKAINEVEDLETLYVFYNKKAGVVAFKNNNKKEANLYFNSILEKFPNTQSKDEIEKFVALTE
ncbi:MAG: tetratricopeptide repeat protein [Solirubrobacteraceae bacterium]